MNSSAILERYRFLTIRFVSSEILLKLGVVYGTLFSTVNTILALHRYNVVYKKCKRLRNEKRFSLTPDKSIP